MICPSCNQSASSLLRTTFSFQGVSFSKNIQGHFKCRHCGTLLHVTGYGKRFWLFYIPTIVLLALYGLSYQSISAIFGNDAGLVLGLLTFVVVTALTISIWKNTQIEKVDADSTTITHSST
jgi:hypothetical protein